ncbi:MAG TPA: TIGR03435 family protein [Vicinamibacterales bacterium]|nr:TIGR03435 family protein [Vicinamibacterales bacterium]
MSTARLTLAAAGLVATVVAGPAAMQQPPAFEVASIKIAPPLDPQKLMTGQMRIGPRVDPSRAEFNTMALADLINYAFRVKSHQVVGPAWLSAGMNAERFDIQATLPAGASVDRVPEMLQALLAERFKLAYHREDREQDVFALIIAKGGVKLKESPPAPEAAPDAAGAGAPPAGGVQVSGNPGSGGVTVRGGPMGTMRMNMGPDGQMRLETERMTMSQLADALTRLVDRPVVDETDLKGTYQVALELAMADLMNMARSAGVAIPAGAGGGAPGGPATAAAEPGGLSVLRSVEALGLKLDSRKMSIAKIVIDRLEKTPTAN